MARSIDKHKSNCSCYACMGRRFGKSRLVGVSIYPELETALVAFAPGAKLATTIKRILEEKLLVHDPLPEQERGE